MNQSNSLVSWAIDPVHSRIRFDTRYLLITTVSGWFREIEGTVSSPEAGFSGCEIALTIYTDSLYTGVQDRDNHLRSADFFDTGRYPTVQFRSTKVLGSDDGRLTVAGRLIIKGIELEIQFNAKFLGEASDPVGNVKAGFEADILLDRKDFNITWNQFFDQNGILISDQVNLHADIQLLRL
jgi:polyisoprenoid-binding protein YceI